MYRAAYAKTLGSVFLGMVCMFALPAQAALTPGQANAIVLLLVSFGAEDAAIARVWNTLMGGAPGALQQSNAGSLSFVEATRPDNASILPGATTTPFTTFSLTNGTNAAATIYSVAIEQTGKGRDSNVEGVLLLDANGVRGTSTPLQEGQADVRSGLVLLPGQSVVLTVAADISSTAKAGQEIQLEVVAINASAPITGDLPISGSARSIKRSR